VNKRRLREASIKLGSPLTEFNAQIEEWTLVNNTDDGEQIFTYAPGTAGEDREDTDPQWAMVLKGPSDWTEGGFSDWSWDHDGETVAFTVIGHSDSVTGWKTQYDGQVKIKAQSVGGANRSTDRFEVTLPIIGKPTYSRPA